ncbi:MAG TPA: hypothetical protein VH054_04550, partial [Polyangiaceae bacterium]|nr:hypothetical protein [Polyangiaceae bacterium]
PNDYDAHLGLALALRGQIDDSNFDKMVADSNAELEAAKKIAPERAETYYNHGILTQEYSAKGTGKAPEPELRKAQALYKEFVSKAGSAAEFADSVKSANDRVKEIDQIIDFNKQTEAQQKATAADAKQKEAEAEAKGENADQNGAPPGDNKDEKKDEAPKAP